MTTDLTYVSACNIRVAREEDHKQAAAKLKEVRARLMEELGSNELFPGLTPDDVKKAIEYKAALKTERHCFYDLQGINELIVRNFKKEEAGRREEEREAKRKV